ncbi:MAG: Type 1 glutamine amidotransferase-like domain-containing protein, partial [Oligoflexia bacterium]|nr:Type 1 glutamine amidotransferase-like domain-containing protein [Oligoflexia bacterium]
NLEHLKNLSSLNLVDFEFFPHYENSKRYDQYFLKYSQKIKSPLYASPNGTGIIVDGDSLQFYGKVCAFFQGKKIKLFT